MEGVLDSILCELRDTRTTGANSASLQPLNNGCLVYAGEDGDGFKEMATD